MSARFSKAAVVAYAQARMAVEAARFRDLTGRDIDTQDGASQTEPQRWTRLARACAEGINERARTVAACYATWRTMRDLVGDVRSGRVTL